MVIPSRALNDHRFLVTGLQQYLEASNRESEPMLRASFFSIGLFVCLWGASFLMVDRIVLTFKDESSRGEGFRGLFTTLNGQRQQVFDPPDWAAFSLMSVGSVTMLYAVALPKKRE